MATIRKQASDYDQELLDLYERYAHGRNRRRDFLQGAAKFAAGGLRRRPCWPASARTMPWPSRWPKDDPRIKTEYVEYASPKGAGKMRGYLARPGEGRRQVAGRAGDP